ncbi:MAG: S8 family serine peptidase [Daejeonella sp.]
MKKILLIISLLICIIHANAQTKEEILKIQEASNMKELQLLSLKYKQMDEERNARVSLFAKQNNWPIFKYNPDGSFDQLMDVTNDRTKTQLYYTISNVNAAKSTRTDHLNTGGSLGLNLNGQNMTADVWDGGPVRTSHQEFGGRVFIADGATTLNGNSNHATHVTGTIAAMGVMAILKGMAPQANVRTYDWNSDLWEATTAAANGMLVSNHSYGFYANGINADWFFGAYTDYSKYWDNLMFNAPYYLMVKAAMNDGNDNVSNSLPLNGNPAFDKLTGMSTAKNNLVVANAEAANVTSNGVLIGVNINSSSSQGPTDDLRIKPDITGNGTGLYSPIAGSDANYTSFSGTSMASPNITGSLLLLQQHYNSLNSNFMRAATLKGLALHTADDAGAPGPDAVFGWGLLNAKKAAETISQNGNKSIIKELILSPGETRTFSVSSDGLNTLMASISWTDPAGEININGTPNLTTPVLVNDLDIRVTQNGTTSFPYKLTSITTSSAGDNLVDPYERADIAGASGSYLITVSHKGVLTNGKQNFSLIITGISIAPCPSDITITNNYSAPLTQSQSWIKSSGQTTILSNVNVKLDANPANGYVLFMPAAATDFFLAEPTASGVFTAQALDGCSIAIPSFRSNETNSTEATAFQRNLTTATVQATGKKEFLAVPEPAFIIYPNPSTGTATIRTKGIEDGVIEVYNLSGNRIYQTDIKVNTFEYKLDLSAYPRGMYLVTISSKGKIVTTQKLILE